jgi:hypothetical protein
MAPLPPLVIVNPYAWERSTVTRLALGELVAAGQLAANEEGRPAEWIVPPAGDHAPNPVVWTSLGPLPRWVPGPTTRWAPRTTRLALHGT